MKAGDRLRRAGFVAAALAAALVCGPSAAQTGASAARDPLGGRLGALEAAFTPAEALRQHQLINAAIEGLAPQRAGQVDVYVVAAGLWGDPVFESEATQAAAALSQALGAQGRTLVLTAGGPPGARRFPAANPHHLQIALGRVGALIDPAEDLVVVFLTSHGNPTGMAFHEQTRLRGTLSPPALAAALTAAGISRRVVIVSACYSGVFVAPLANEDTIVLTAAARDRQSFGCQPEREWTYFGDALINQGLRAGKPLLQAFEEGRGLIDQWERRDNFTPSNPQSHIGSRAQRALQTAEAAAGAGRE